MNLIQFVLDHAHLAHWFIFCGILLAGMSLPISTDLLVIIAAILAANTIPEHTFILFFSVLFGCYFSAWIAYWIGRKLGPLLLRFRFFQKLLNEEKLAKIRAFYERRGLLTLIIGRFIPFGVRNALFMSTGMSRLSFGKFIARDALACTIWSTASFSSFYFLGKNYTLLYGYVKTFNILIFSLFGIATIVTIWYKRRKKSAHAQPIE
ncbi:MAG: DedA family protein [Chlamydiales bacterium]